MYMDSTATKIFFLYYTGFSVYYKKTKELQGYEKSLQDYVNGKLQSRFYGE